MINMPRFTYYVLREKKKAMRCLMTEIQSREKVIYTLTLESSARRLMTEMESC
jgi:hypothetical protein